MHRRLVLGDLADLADVTGTETVSVSIAGDVVQDSTQKVTESSTQLITQTSSELDITQQTTQSGSLIMNAALALGESGMKYIRGSERDEMGRQVSGDASGQ
jgi:hypothetical protein